MLVYLGNQVVNYIKAKPSEADSEKLDDFISSLMQLQCIQHLRAITIEVASDTTAPYAMKDDAYNTLINLLADICQRNGIKKLLWQGDKSLIGTASKQNMTVHRWFAAKACPGDYLYERHGGHR